MELGHFDKDFVQNTTGNRGPTGSYSEALFQGPVWKHFFPSRYYILNGKFNPKVDTIRAFLSKSRTVFLIFSCPPQLRVCECG